MKNIAIVLFACLINFTAFAQKKAATAQKKATTVQNKAAVANKKADAAQKKIDEATASFDKELQGTWKLNEVINDRVYINLVKKQITYPEAIEKEHTPEQRASIEAYKSTYLTRVAASTIVFKGKSVSYYILGDKQTGTYTLKQKGDGYIADIVSSDGSIESIGLTIKDNILNAAKAIKGTDNQMVFIKYVPRK